ncbi:PREDICTED: uncharacterized protein LOC105458270 [Wasmannia auropunctata]|uniref:uncharacterized protein LOC105458270 n=1 Tax=Wasmannia auropunctata TaxID=64793 RepID=UPI0005EFA8ED|nr:PREDICTED: uncharacterized protein LOC105458270 [Wasmannia auropunctata]
MLELRRGRTFRAGMQGKAAYALLPMREGGSYVAHVPELYGKRVKESKAGGNSTPSPKPPQREVASGREVAYSAFGPNCSSSLLFLRVTMSGRELRALVDSGSSRTFLGSEAVDLLKGAGFSFRSGSGPRVTTATNQTTRVRGETEVPITLGGRTRNLRVCSLPTLALPCILGMDFLAAFGIVVNFVQRAWIFEDNPSRRYRFEEESANFVSSIVTASLVGEEMTDAAPPVSGKREGESTPKMLALEYSCDREAPPGEGEATDSTTLEKASSSLRTPQEGGKTGGLIELSDNERARLERFLATEVTGDPERPGTTSLTEHRIDVGGHAPIKQRYYPVSPKVQEAIYKEVDKMLDAGIIEPSNSEWSTPIVMVKKPNGSYRFCLDFRKLNSASKKDAYPLPYMNAILDKLRAARYISTIDLSQAYFQIPLEINSRELTAFTVPGKGLFHFTRMPYGLTGAPATFQRLLDRLIGPEMEPHAFAYLDDIVVVTPTFEEHIKWLKKVFERIREAG